MGVVYKAYDSRLDRHVAIKQMAAELDDDPQLRQRFNQEARSAARLNHRNIITIYELDESGTDIYIVMELLEGVDLATLMKRKTPLPLEAQLNMMAQVCDGLDYAHKKGIIHRDIKPANLHVSPAGVVTILDFGIARLAASKMTSTGGLVGTPDYMSPEQVMAAHLDARSDLFAIGAVTYELLSGSKPFEADSVTALLMKIVRDPHVPLRQRAPHLPAAAIDLVERLLAKNPDDRPSSAQEVQEALLAISTDKSPLDAMTVSILASAVSEETLKPRTPPPPTRPVRKSTSAPPAPIDSSSRLASLAVERGRAMRESGDLGGAMKVFRSVLEIAPGNTEALRELEEMERAFARLSTLGRAAPEVPVEEPAPAALTERTAPPPPPREPVAAAPAGALPPARGSSQSAGVRSRSAGVGTIAAGIVAVVALGGAAFYLWSSRQAERTEETATTFSTVLTSTTTSTTPITETTPPPAQTVAPPEIVVLAPPSSAPPAPAVQADRRSAARVTTTSVAGTATTGEPAAASAPAAGPPPAPISTPPAAPTLPPAPEPAPAAAAAPGNSVVVRHFHARVLFRGGGYCDGTLELLPDGVHFKTTSSSDGRKDDKKIPFAAIEAHEIDGDRLHIETDDKNWDFGAPKDVLQRIEQYLKANVKS